MNKNLALAAGLASIAGSGVRGKKASNVTAPTKARKRARRAMRKASKRAQ